MPQHPTSPSAARTASAWVLLACAAVAGCRRDPHGGHRRFVAEANVATLRGALEDYAELNGKYPASLEDLVTPMADGSRMLNRETVPLDPWGRPFIYIPPGEAEPRPHLLCYGEDGVPGGEGEDADIDDWTLFQR